MSALNALLHADGREFEKLNNVVVLLLPKQPEALSPGDFRPITMIHSFAKLVSKVLVLRLVPKMKQLVSPNQNAFIRSRAYNSRQFQVRPASSGVVPQENDTKAALEA